MKKLILSIGVAALAVACNAQMPFSLSGQWGAGAGYEHELGGNNSIVYGFITYDIVTNSSGLSGGIIGGEEKLWNAGQSSVQTFNGGFQFSYTLKPFQQLGLGFGTNITATVGALTVMSTPRNSSAPIANVTGTFVALNVYNYKNWVIKLEGQFVTRTGDGEWDGKYIGGGLAISHNF